MRDAELSERWRYGDAWERFPIVASEPWQHTDSESIIAVHDLRDGLPDFMRADMVYCDPPWSRGNANAFLTKAGRSERLASFDEFLDPLFSAITAIGPRVCFLECGKQNLDLFGRRLFNLFPVISVWPITYYRKRPCYLLRGGAESSPRQYAGLDDEATPAAAIEAETPATVADPCTGRGLTLLAAHRRGARFVGTELNRRRLAVAIDRAANAGIVYQPGTA